jgi:hypothetical protein
MHDHTTVGTIRVFELQVQDKIIVLFAGPDALIFGGGQNAIGTYAPNAFGLDGVREVLGKKVRPDFSLGVGVFFEAGLGLQAETEEQKDGEKAEIRFHV